MKNEWLPNIFIFCFVIHGVSTESTNIECSVDYHGIIHFSANLPKGYTSWKGLHPLFYYKNKGKRLWKQIDDRKDCNYVRKKEKFRCAFQELTKKDRTLKDKVNGYEFKLSLLLNSTIVNYTVMNFINDPTVKVAPWQTVNQITYCEDGYGVKYIATNASLSSIGIEWIRFPLDVDYGINFETYIRIVGPGIDKKDLIDKQTCKDDLCDYHYPSLKPCSKYNVCLKTYNNLKTRHQEMCRNVTTYCNVDKTIKWQDTLLCVFGAIILMICAVMLWALFNKHSQFSGMFNNSQNEIVNQEDLVNPSMPVMNGSIHHDYHEVDDENVYHYPYAMVTIQ